MPPEIKVTMHEIQHRVFTVDVQKMCAAYELPGEVADDELAEILEHTDTWENGTPNWLAEKLPREGWRELYEVDRGEPVEKSVPPTVEELFTSG